MSATLSGLSGKIRWRKGLDSELVLEQEVVYQDYENCKVVRIRKEWEPVPVVESDKL